MSLPLETIFFNTIYNKLYTLLMINNSTIKILLSPLRILNLNDNYHYNIKGWEVMHSQNMEDH